MDLHFIGLMPYFSKSFFTKFCGFYGNTSTISVPQFAVCKMCVLGGSSQARDCKIADIMVF